jgi:cell division protein ZapB
LIRLEVMMLEETLAQMEQLIGDLLTQNQQLLASQAELTEALAQIKEENDTLQLQVMEMEEKQGIVVARLQAMLQRAGKQVAAPATGTGNVIASA